MEKLDRPRAGSVQTPRLRGWRALALMVVVVMVVVMMKDG